MDVVMGFLDWIGSEAASFVIAFESDSTSPGLLIVASAIVFWVVSMAIIMAIIAKNAQRRQEDLRENLDKLTHSVPMSPEALMRNKSALLSGGDFTGVYIIHNMTKDMYYVGQGVRVISRLCQHFQGHGNGDVYADWKYGDVLTVKVVRLSTSGYDSLNQLEHDYITRYDACDRGYNRTHGNKA